MSEHPVTVTWIPERAWGKYTEPGYWRATDSDDLTHEYPDVFAAWSPDDDTIVLGRGEEYENEGLPIDDIPRVVAVLQAIAQMRLEVLAYVDGSIA